MGNKASWSFVRRAERELPIPAPPAWGTEHGPSNIKWLWLSSSPIPTAAAVAPENMKGSSTR